METNPNTFDKPKLFLFLLKCCFSLLDFLYVQMCCLLANINNKVLTSFNLHQKTTL